jgi:hypothetical protein
MKKISARLAPTLVLALAVGAQTPALHAEMIATPDVAAEHSAEADRAKVQRFLEQATVKERLQAMGVDGLAATERVAALDQQEIHALAQHIDTMPAGGALTTMEWILIVLIAILVAIAI